MRGAFLLIPTASALMLIAACSTATGGEPKPTKVTPSQDGSTSTLPHSGAPKVEDPMNAATLRMTQQDPCGTLTTEQVTQLRLSPQGQSDDAQSGPFCRWRNVDAGSSAGINFPTEVNFEGLSQIYKISKLERNADFFYEMPPIQGFPVIASSTSDARDLGTCPVQVGLTDRQVMYVGVTISREKRGQLEPCATAREVAGMALTTMKGGG